MNLIKHFFADFIRIKKAPGRNKKAFFWVLPLAIGLIGAALVYGPTHAINGAIAARVSGAGREQPIRRRLRIATTAFISSQCFLIIGMYASHFFYTEVLAIVLVTSFGLFCWFAMDFGVPGRINMAFATSYGVYLGSIHHTVSQVLHVNLLVWFLCMASALFIMTFDLHHAERAAVEAAEKAVDAYVDLANKDDPALRDEVDDARLSAYVKLNNAWCTVRTGRSNRNERISRAAARLEARINEAYFKLIARLEARYFPQTPIHMQAYAQLHSLGRPSLMYLFSTAWRYGSRPRTIAVRTMVALAIGQGVSWIFHIGHTYWAMLAALIVLHQGASRFDSVVRGFHRVIGTSIGLCCYVGILLLVDNVWLRLFIVICCIYGLECFTPRNYGIAVVFITCYALLLVPAAHTGDMMTIVHDRLLETIVGISSAIIAVWLINDARALVYRHYRNTILALCAVLTSMTRESFTAYHAVVVRRNLLFEISSADEMLKKAVEDNPMELQPWFLMEREVFRFVGVVLTANWRMTTRDPDVIAHSKEAAQWAEADLRAVVNQFPIASPQPVDATSLAQRINQTRMEFAIRTL